MDIESTKALPASAGGLHRTSRRVTSLVSLYEEEPHWDGRETEISELSSFCDRRVAPTRQVRDSPEPLSQPASRDGPTSATMRSVRSCGGIWISVMKGVTAKDTSRQILFVQVEESCRSCAKRLNVPIQ